jgi:hypothetical protein
VEQLKLDEMKALDSQVMELQKTVEDKEQAINSLEEELATVKQRIEHIFVSSFTMKRDQRLTGFPFRGSRSFCRS